ncbi:zincin [Serendipita vermifera]|nr:zincin [Serendipita vermifera]
MRNLVLILSLAGIAYAQTTATTTGYEFVGPQEPHGTEDHSYPIGANLTTVEIFNHFQDEYQNVTYYVNSFGEAIYDDDIIWGSEELLLSWRVTGDEPSRKKRWYAVKPAYGWPSFPIPYRYDTADTKAKIGTHVDAALAKWIELAPYLSFEERDPNPTFEKGIVVITSTEGDGCHSNAAFESVGFEKTKPHINLASGCLGRQPKHEWGHQLGLFHEHKRPDRNDWVTFDCKALEPRPLSTDPPNKCDSADCCDSPTSTCCYNLLYQFQLDSDISKYQMQNTYDFESIMHYSGDAFARSDGTPYPYNTQISTGDVEGVCAIYKTLCDESRIPKCGTCNPVAGLNKCDITTSCITTGTGANHYCACRAGFKATTATDPTKQFRLPMPGQEYRVFVPENTPCNELCNYPHGFSPLLCAEVDLQNTCAL